MERRKKRKWFDNEDEFANCLDPRDEKYATIFQWSRSQLKKYMELDSNEDENDNYNEYKSSKRKKKEDDDEDDD